MGEPAIPDERDRRDALARAEAVLDAIRNDAPELSIHGFAAWLIASTLVWQAERIEELERGQP